MFGMLVHHQELLILMQDLKGHQLQIQDYTPSRPLRFITNENFEMLLLGITLFLQLILHKALLLIEQNYM